MGRNGITMGNQRISEARYRELAYFCRQHPEKRTRAAAAIMPARAWMPERVRGGSTGDPTGAAAARRERLRRDIEAVEQSARDAVMLAGLADSFAPLLTAYVCGTARLHPDDFPMGRRQFYRMRRTFFMMLDERLGGGMAG